MTRCHFQLLNCHLGTVVVEHFIFQGNGQTKQLPSCLSSSYGTSNRWSYSNTALLHTHYTHMHTYTNKYKRTQTHKKSLAFRFVCIVLDIVMGTEKSHLGFILIFSLIRRTATFSLFCQVDRCRKVSKTKYSYRPIYNQVSNIKRA